MPKTLHDSLHVHGHCFDITKAFLMIALSNPVTCVFLVMQGLLLLMASLSAAVPLQDGDAESYSAKMPLLDDMLSNPTGFLGYSVPTGANSDAPKFLALSSDTDPEKNSEIDLGLSGTTNSNSNNAMVDLNPLGSSFQLGQPITLSSAPSILDNSGSPEVSSDNVENSRNMSPLIVAQHPIISTCAADGTKASKPDQCSILNLYIYPPENVQNLPLSDYEEKNRENFNAIKQKDGDWLDNLSQDELDRVMGSAWEKICGGFKLPNKRPMPFCCFGEGTIISYVLTRIGFIQITNQGNCVTLIPGRPRCDNPLDWFCCRDMGKLMPWGWMGMSCIAAR